MYIWLPDYIRQVLERPEQVSGVKHILFLFVDHYEPGWENGEEKNKNWLANYRSLADRHSDSYGRKPQHTWFFAYDQRNDTIMAALSSFTREDYGEIEFHWHHGNDTNATFPEKLEKAVQWFNTYGVMISREGCVNFGFIHGNWALDNSGKIEHCGVSRELEILKKAGCYADFTFPSFGNKSQPAKINSIYYAEEDDENKSYNSGVDVQVGSSNKRDLMIFQGPLTLKDYGAVESRLTPDSKKIDSWINANIHVKGRPEWIFVKVYTHGIQSRKTIFSDVVDDMFSYLEKKYSQGEYRLHYVTAREAYNIVRAAEDGKTGDPNDFLNYEISPPRNKE